MQKGEKLIKQGSFQLDMGRAIGKLSRYQLEDPHRYVLELISAAVASGALQIHIQNDSSDLIVEWVGIHPTEEELTKLFSFIFESGQDDQSRMLRHLAQGIYGAKALDPSWIRLERPGLLVDYQDLAKPLRHEIGRIKGMKMHIKERFGWKVFMEAINFFDEAYESQLIRKDAVFSQTPIYLNGEQLRAPSPPNQAIEYADGYLWLQHRSERSWGYDGVLLVQDGVVIDVIVLEISPLRLCGWIHCTSLKRNASRSKVIQDEKYEELFQEIHSEAFRLVATYLQVQILQTVEKHPLSDDDLPATMPELHELAMQMLRRAQPKPKTDLPAEILDLPLLRDACGRWYSIALLQQYPKEGIAFIKHGAYTTDSGLLRPAPGLSMPQFSVYRKVQGSHPFYGGFTKTALAYQDSFLRSFFGLQEKQQRSTIMDYHRGCRRRNELKIERINTPVWHFVHTFAGDTFTGKIGVVFFATKKEKQMMIDVCVDGLAVEEVSSPRSPMLRAEISSPSFTTNLRFDRIQERAIVKAAVQQTKVEADKLIAELLEDLKHQRLGSTPRGGAWVLDMIWQKLQNKSSVRGKERAVFSNLAFLLDLNGRFWAPNQLPKTVRWGKSFHVQVDRLPQELRQATFELQQWQQALLKKLVRRSWRNVEHDLGDRVTALIRQSRNPREPVLRDVKWSHNITLDGLKGQLSFGPDEEKTVEILHQGVSLGHYELKSAPRGSIAIVSWENATPNARWDALHSLKQLDRLDKLLTEQWLHAAIAFMGQKNQWKELPVWLLDSIAKHPNSELSQQALFRDVKGRLYSLHDLIPEVNGGAIQKSFTYFGPAIQSEKPKSILQSTLLLPKPEFDLLTKLASTYGLTQRFVSIQGLIKRQEAYLRKPQVSQVQESPPVFTRTWRATYAGVRVWLRFFVTPDELFVAPGVIYSHFLWQKRSYLEHNIVGFVGGKILCWTEHEVPLFAAQKNVQAPTKKQQNDFQQFMNEQISVSQNWLLNNQNDLDRSLQRHILYWALGKVRRRVSNEQFQRLQQLKQKFVDKLQDKPIVRTLTRWGDLHSLSRVDRKDQFFYVTKQTLLDAECVVDSDGFLLAPLSLNLECLVFDNEQELIYCKTQTAWELIDYRQRFQKLWQHTSSWMKRQSQELVPTATEPCHARASFEEDGLQVWMGLFGSLDFSLRSSQIELFVKDKLWTTRKHVQLKSGYWIWLRMSDPKLKLNDEYTKVLPLKRFQKVIQKSYGLLNRMIENVCGLASIVPDKPSFSVQLHDLQHARQAAFTAAINGTSKRRNDWSFCRDVNGQPITLKQLRGQRQLYVVDENCRQASKVHPERLLIPASKVLRRILRNVGRVEDYQVQLLHEESRIRRQNLKVSLAEPDAGSIHVKCSGKRQGFLQLRFGNNQKNSVIQLYVEQAEIETITVDAPFIVSGHINDDSLKPNYSFEFVEKDSHYKSLLSFIKRSVADMVVKELQQKTLSQQQYVDLLLQSFYHVSQLAKATKVQKSLAEFTFFHMSMNDQVSALQLAKKKRCFRWAPPTSAKSHLFHDFPFVWLPKKLVDALQPLLGGQWCPDEAEQEARLQKLSRRTLPAPKQYLLHKQLEITQNVKAWVALQPTDEEGRCEVYLYGAFLVRFPLTEKGALVQFDIHTKPSYRIKEKLPEDWQKKVKKAIQQLLLSDLVPSDTRQVPNKMLMQYMKRIWRTKQLKSMWVQASIFATTLSGYKSLASLQNAVANGHHILLGNSAKLPAGQKIWVAHDCSWNRNLLEALGVQWYAAERWFEVFQKQQERERYTRKMLTFVQQACSAVGYPPLTDSIVEDRVYKMKLTGLSDKEVLLMAWQLIDDELVRGGLVRRAAELAIYFGEQLAKIKKQK